MRSIVLNHLFLFALLVIPFVGTAQGDDKEDRDDKIEKLKIAFITKKLNLTSEEAEKFWPIYNEMENKIKELRKANRSINKELEDNFDKLSEEDAKKKLNTVFENETKETAIRKEYAEKITKVIGSKRTLKLLSLEHEFRRELLETLRENRQGPPPPHGPRPNGERP